ncbi:MAG: hypothetical protein PF690_17490 [Deltaproteobacteria bacterium]|jgi:hypothetical protein|nr:hypothetical protein [Deltaproteobacteria bacterium]
MVRYPHTAIVTASAVTVTAGEYASSADTTTSITGRMQSSGAPSKIKDPSGDWIETNRVFFTQAENVENAEKLTVSGYDYRILLWEPKQSHSKIWLD